MRRLILISATSLMLLIASTAHAQEMTQQSQLSSLFARTETRAREARLNFERLIANFPEFLPELQRVAARLETRPEWLLNVMACESSFVASARNPLPGQTASGLLQIIRQTAIGLGTTTAAISRMNPIEQLQFVEKYFVHFRGNLNSLADVYLAVFRGFIVNGGPETVVAPLNNSSKERQAYSLNKGLDLNGDRRITKEELAMVAFGVGRFSGVQPVTATHSQISEPQQRGISVAMRPRVISREVVIPARAKSKQPSSPAESFQVPTVINKTRSTYVH
jgi:Transglycosylase SLT domain